MKWIKEHVRLYAKRRDKRGGSIDLLEDDLDEVVDKAQEQTEVGVKFTFKF